MEQKQSQVLRIFSVISYLRNLFGEDDYVEQRGESMRMRILSPTPSTARLIAWIRTAESVAQYTRQIVLTIYRGARPVESYSVQPDDAADMRGLCSVLQRLPPLVGRVRLRLRIYSVVSLRLDGFREASEASEASEWAGGVASAAVTIRRRGITIALANGKAYERVAERPAEEKREAEKKPVTEKKDERMDSWSIRCVCTIDSNDGEMMQCDACGQWLHTHCCGFFSNQDSRIPAGRYSCLVCLGAASAGQRGLAIYRRILGIVYNEEFGGPEYLVRRLGLSETYVGHMMRRLAGDGFVERADGGYRASKTREAKQRLKEYFSGIRLECSVSIESVDVRCE